MLAAVLFKLGILVSVQLIALTCALFLCIYVKKHELSKWYSFFSTAITSVIVLMMVATFVGIICMACCKRNCHEGGEEKRMYMHQKMWRGGHGGCQMNEENCGRGEGMGCRGEENEECDGDESDCKDGKSCKMPDEEKTIVIIKDTIIKKK